MTLFFSYIFRQVAGALAMILMSLGGIVWIGLALKQLEVVTAQGQSFFTFVAMTTLALPHLLAVIAPFALLIATIHALNRLNGDSELIVITASGANIWVVGRPLLLLAVIVSLAVAFVNHVAMPWSLQLLREYIIEVRTDLLTQVIQPGKFSTPETGLTFHIRDRTFEGELKGLVVDDRRKEGEAQSYLAERAQIIKQGGSNYLMMKDGHILQYKAGGTGAQIVAFEQYVVDLDQFDKQDLGDISLKPREMYTSDLLYPDPSNANYRHRPGKFIAELHERFANPLYPIVFVLIALASVGQAQSTRQNRMESMVVACLAGFGVRLGGLAVNNMVSMDQVYVPLIYAIPVAAVILSLIAIWWTAKPRGGPSLRDRIVFAIGDAFARLPIPRFRRAKKSQGAENMGGVRS